MQMGLRHLVSKFRLWIWNSNENVVYNVFNRRPPMFSCIQLQKQQQCCEPKIGGEIPFTNKLLSKSSVDQIHYEVVCKISIM